MEAEDRERWTSMLSLYAKSYLLYWFEAVTRPIRTSFSPLSFPSLSLSFSKIARHVCSTFSILALASSFPENRHRWSTWVSCNFDHAAKREVTGRETLHLLSAILSFIIYRKKGRGNARQKREIRWRRKKKNVVRREDLCRGKCGTDAHDFLARMLHESRLGFHSDQKSNAIQDMMRSITEITRNHCTQTSPWVHTANTRSSREILSDELL